MSYENPEDSAALVRRFRRLGFTILVIGLISALAIILFAHNVTDDASAYQNVGGVSYPVDVNNSRTYQNSIEKVGGKSALVAVEMDDWFSSLWHGKRLGYTIGLISVVSALISYLLAYLLSLPPHEDEEKNKDWRG